MTGQERNARAAQGRRIPRLIEFLGLHLGLGIAIGFVFASLIVITNTSGLKDLLVNSQEPLLTLGLLYGLNALTFGSVAMGIGVMTLPVEEVIDMREKSDRDAR
ncbi:MAG: hypothetical protein NW216_13910 [Hyphomicrobium sp.]|nr:hypothetical protein [Hyphomicrobium sp.]